MALKKAQPSFPAWMLQIQKHRHLIVPVGFVLMLGVILVPMATWFMDIMIAANISLAVIILLTTIYMEKPLQFSVFPSLLLATTLLRLVLNIATTRLILGGKAHSADQAIGIAGKVISAFGDFVAGESLVVGVIIFLILVVVQFMVITKGATRISEVAARFTLDAMPGKQMAIDSDLNAGIIDEAQARHRREEISREADFFGAMDGASKFVRGDAIAGILITAINILGGFAIGALQNGWPIGQTAEVYTKLTIGDGLTSQLPSFIISIAAALIVTRSGSDQDLGTELTGQLISQPKALVITAGFLSVLALTPLPTIPLLAIAGVLGAMAFFTTKSTNDAIAEEQELQQTAQAPEPTPVESLMKVDTLELEVGYALVALVDQAQGGDLLDKITSIRRQLALDLGFVMPPVRIRDNMQIDPNEYRVKIRLNPVAVGSVYPGRLLAMDPGIATGPIDGDPTTEPAFGLEAWWIDPALQRRAETMNYTVVDATSVLGTHLTEIVKHHAHELLTREEVMNLIEQLKDRSPRLVEEVIPGIVKPADLQKVLQNLLRERIGIRDMETIVETLAEWAPKTQDVDILTEYVRNSLRRWVSQQFAELTDDGAQRIVCVTLDPVLEDMINAYVDRSGVGTTVTMPPDVATRVTEQIMQGVNRLVTAGHQPVVIASPQVRAVVRQLVEPSAPSVAVLGYNEIIPGIQVESVALITSPEGLAVGVA